MNRKQMEDEARGLVGYGGIPPSSEIIALAEAYRAAGMREAIEVAKGYRVTLPPIGPGFQDSQYVSVADMDAALARLLDENPNGKS